MMQCFCMLGAMRIDVKRIVGPLSALILAACASTAPAPVTDLTAGSAASAAAAASTAAGDKSPQDGVYPVGSGDTLYAIALANDLDWRDLARWNNIAAPYTIRPGMRLVLDGPPAPARTVADSGSRGAPVAVFEPLPEPVAPIDAPETEPLPDVAPLAPSSVGATADVGTVAVAVEEAPQIPVQADSVVRTAGAPATSREVGGIDWSWPAAGSLEDHFEAGNPARQGIDIGGQRGAPVRAAADGEVVYSGNGLVGYGELVIIKHSDRFLSAYGHNSARLVKEGEQVSRGETIAEMGSSGASHVALHFEIRAEGKPVDPLAFLPRKN